jgi:hypothetical protein
MYIQGGVLPLPSTWFALAWISCGSGATASSSLVQGTYLQLGIAAMLFFVVNAVFRISTALWQISYNRHRLQVSNIKYWISFKTR